MDKDDNPGTRLIALAHANPKFAGLTRKALAEAFGVTYETLRKWVEGESAPSRNRAADLAELLGVRPESFMHGVMPSVNQNLSGDPAHLARPVSYGSVILGSPTDLPVVKWRDSNMLIGHARFCVIAPDDSMQPVVLEGMKVDFDSTLTPLNKDVVLVEDNTGDWYIRTYLRAPNERWKAKAEHSDYVMMDNDGDGLKVLAVMTGTRGRRG